MSTLNHILLCFLVGVALANIYDLEGRRDQRIITAIKDNGCASKQVLSPVVMRIDNYDIKAL